MSVGTKLSCREREARKSKIERARERDRRPHTLAHTHPYAQKCGLDTPSGTNPPFQRAGVVSCKDKSRQLRSTNPATVCRPCFWAVTNTHVQVDVHAHIYAWRSECARRLHFLVTCSPWSATWSHRNADSDSLYLVGSQGLGCRDQSVGGRAHRDKGGERRPDTSATQCCLTCKETSIQGGQKTHAHASGEWFAWIPKVLAAAWSDVLMLVPPGLRAQGL